MNVKKSPFIIAILLLSSLSCSLVDQLIGGSSPTPTPADEVAVQTPISERMCGDGVCDGPENGSNCPSDCPPSSDFPPGGLLQPGPNANSYWVTNPTSGAKLFVSALYPGDWSGENLPTLVLVPGGVGTIDPSKGRRLVDEGFLVIFSDPDGRGSSEGTEDLGGYIHQDGLATVIRAIASLPGVDVERIGLVSFSYGITMASGSLARNLDLPVAFLIDWEGPADRQDTTIGCQPNPQINWPDCSDDAAWAEREALTFIAQVRVPYQRLQSKKDHVQPDVSHAINMVNAAVQGEVPWVRLNNLLPDQTYDPVNPPPMLPEKADSTLETLIASIAKELFISFP